MRRYDKWLPLVIVAAGIAAYLNSLSGVFLFDDRLAIVENARVMRILPLNWGPRVWVELSFGVNYALAGVDVLHYHVTNLALHIAAGLALFGIVRRVLGRPFFRGGYDRAAAWLGGGAAVMWIVHPLQTESVTYICQRYEVMMGLFWLTAFYCLVRGYASQRPWVWWCASGVAFAIGLGTKEIIVTFPVMALVYDHVFEGGELRRRMAAHRGALAAAIVVGLVALFPVLRVMVAGVAAQQRHVEVSWVEYLATQCGVILHYLRLAIRPHPLCLDYAWPVARGWREIAGPAVVMVLLVGGTVWGVVRKEPIGFIGAWVFTILAPTSSVFPIEDMAFEHRMYLPLAGPIVLFVVFVHRAVGRVAARRTGLADRAWPATAGGIAAICVLMAALTVKRNHDYHSEVRMWRQTVRVRPGNLRARVALSAALLAEGAAGEAEELLRKTLDELPDDSARPGYRVEYVRGKTLNGLGVIRQAGGHLAEAEDLFRRALAVEADFGRARNNLGIVLQKQGREAEARQEWRETLRRAPGNQKARLCLASSFLKERNYAQAKVELEAMRLLGPEGMAARLPFAWLLATCPDPAVRDGSLAAKLLEDISSGHPVTRVRIHDIRGAALAATGHYEDAAEEATKAIRIAGELGVTGMGAIKDRLALYRAGRPFVETEQPRR